MATASNKKLIHSTQQKGLFDVINNTVENTSTRVGDLIWGSPRYRDKSPVNNGNETNRNNTPTDPPPNTTTTDTPPPAATPPKKKEPVQKYKYWFLDFMSKMVNARLDFGRFVYRHAMTKLHERIQSGVEQTLVIRPEDVDNNIYLEVFEFDKLPVNEDSDIKPYIKNMFKNLPKTFKKSGVNLTDVELEEMDKEIRQEYIHRFHDYQLVDTNCDAMGTASKIAAFRNFKEYVFHLVNRTDQMSHADYNMYRCIMTNIINYFQPYMNVPLIIGDDVEPDYKLPNDVHGETRRFRVSYEYCKAIENLKPGEIVVGLATTFSFTEKKNVEQVAYTTINFCTQPKYRSVDLFNDVYIIHITMIHEMLHAFGFGHNPNMLSVMTPIINENAIGVAVDPTIMSLCDYHGLTLVYGCPPHQPESIGEFKSEPLTAVKERLNKMYYGKFFDALLEYDEEEAGGGIPISEESKYASIIKKISVNRFYNNLTELFEPITLKTEKKYMSKFSPIIFYLRNVQINKIIDEIRIIEYLLPYDHEYGFMFTYDNNMTEKEYEELHSVSEQILKVTNPESNSGDSHANHYSLHSYNVESSITKDRYTAFSVIPIRLGLSQKNIPQSDGKESIYTKISNTITNKIEQNSEADSEEIAEKPKGEDIKEIYNFHHIHKEQLSDFTGSAVKEDLIHNLVISPIGFNAKNVKESDHTPLKLHKLPYSTDIFFTSEQVIIRPYAFNNLDAVAILFPLL